MPPPQRQCSERRSADEPVAMFHFRDHLRRDRAPACDTAQELGDVVHRIRAAVSQKQNRAFLRTKQFVTPDGTWGRAVRLARGKMTPGGSRRIYHAARAPLHCEPVVISADCSWINLASALTFSTGVSGRMP